MTNEDGYDWARFPYVVNAVLDMMPNGATWRAEFADAAGLDLWPEADGYLTVMHRGDVVMRIATETFLADRDRGRARVMVDGAWRDLDLWAPDGWTN